MTSRVTALRGVGPSLEPTTTTSDGSRRVDKNLESRVVMANKETTECEQEQQDQGCCREGQEADEERTSRSGGPEGANCNLSQFEEGRPHSSTYADPESHKQSPETGLTSVNSFYAASQTGAIRIVVQSEKSS